MSKLPSRHAIPHVICGQDELLAVRDALHERSDITYRNIADVSLVKLDLLQSLFTGTIATNCRFELVNFSRGDLDGCIFTDCFFKSCSFENCDIRTTVLARCSFEDCTFDGALLIECEVKDCVFRNSRFESSVQTENVIQSTMLDRCDLRRSSLTLCNWSGSSFADCNLGDCTFLYMIMKQCKFNSTSINAESLGMIYGLNVDELSDLRLIYLGQDQAIPEDCDLIQSLELTYLERSWYSGAMVLRLNFGLRSTLYAMSEYLAAIVLQARSGFLLKRDELRFLMRIVSDLRSRAELPALFLILALRSLRELRQQVEAVHSERTVVRHLLDSLTLVDAELSSAWVAELDRFESLGGAVGHLNGPDAPLALRLEFEHKPGTDLLDLLLDLREATGWSNDIPLARLEVKHGSYIELIAGSLLTAYALQLFLWLINGTVLQLTELKERMRVLLSRNTSRAYRDLARAPNQLVPTHLAAPIEGLELFIKRTEWIRDSKLAGLGGGNLRRVEVIGGGEGEISRSSEGP